ncbi:MAG: Asp-tRNA(Asn)/Glu-tRNA(Gln) amidotransferase subunit GatA [Oscillospiraceae bacterium]|nr:Asp-tRNA(Asn)/Glu-tRNA(Gln) amidotransferase subunit GatA [Oscillospiraceae bacterium]MDD7041268.1 Asp-tRNA(Asn)/Glu-tRNA(Gln) amidotransferase subunit GatA [Oscillospiraceae bacterium]MDY2611535.1 Asp-tRNA(Asn)/Glu-tRNA(Gln) amidotransferase subunit GatA [Oscillospiraceae bacterium]
MELFEMTAASLSEKLRKKECSAVEITRSVLEQIEKTEDKIGSFVTVCEEQALKKAEEVDRKIAAGEALSSLAGIPIGVKDNICTKDVLTTCSSKMLYNFVPPYDATVVSRLKQADAVIIGKCNMDEFAMGSSCETSYFKKTKNPWDPAYVPGGSSGGSAACVSAGEAVLSLGSDTGGSIRLPASYCGVVGLKPTYGSVSRYGLVAFASSLDQIGPLGRSVEDVANLYEVICGRDPMDATSAAREYGAFAQKINRSVKGLRIGIPKEYFGDGVEPEIKAAVLESVDRLVKEGAQMVSISLPSTDYALSAYYIISSAEASSNLARFDGVKYGYRAKDFTNLIDMYEKTRSEGFGDEVKRRIMLGTFVLSSGFYDAYYKRAKQMQQKIAQEYAEAFSQCDIILTPTSPSTAFRMGERTDDPLKMYAADICTVTVNIAGLPAISVPCATVSNGLPVGMQMIGPKFSEQMLFDAAGCFENICGGFGVAPSVKA